MTFGSWEFWKAPPMPTDDFFRARLDSMIDMRHPLAVLATRMPWAEIEAALAPAFAHRDRKGNLVEGADLFGPTSELVAVGVSARGRSRLPIRLMVSLLYLKHAFNLSDEELVQRLERERAVPVLQRHAVLRAAAAVRPDADRALPPGAR